LRMQKREMGVMLSQQPLIVENGIIFTIVWHKEMEYQKMIFLKVSNLLDLLLGILFHKSDFIKILK